MNRKNFLKKSLLATVLSAPTVQKVSAEDQPEQAVGFNHLPVESYATMNTVLHKAGTRGHAQHGWLDSHHTFSFAHYHNPQRMNFGVLRVLNDDIVEGGMGFGTHPHENMEIISIPLSGDLEHKDSMGNVAVIKQYDVQIMSAGTGIYHSEYNKNKDRNVNFLQIWVFPKEKNINPRYEQKTFTPESRLNRWQEIVSAHRNTEGIWINQDAWFYLGNFEAGINSTYKLKKAGNGIYAFVIHGQVTVDQQKLDKRDGFGLWDVEQIALKAETNAEVLLMEVPMK
jgi:hypothetical protein